MNFTARQGDSMRRLITSITVAALAALAPPAAHAGPIIDWDPAYFYESGATPYSSIAGHQLFIVGTISVFGAPLDFLNASDPSKDYTFYLHGLTSNGTVTSSFPPYGNFFTTTYTGGLIEIYEGTPRNSVFDPFPPNANVPSTFTDGTLILSGSITSFYWQSNDFTQLKTGNAEGTILWTGGAYFPLVSHNQLPCPSLFTGGLTWRPSVMIDGYLFRHQGKLDLDCPTPAKPSSWGRLKTLYR
jgi:hypothetical protein